MNNRILTKLVALSLFGFLHGAHAALLTVKLPGNSINFTTTVNSFFDANVFIDSTPDLGGFDFSLIYDSTKLSAVSFSSASVFGAADTETLANSIVPGTVRLSEAIFAGSTLTQGLNINAPTLLGTVHFKALGTVALSPIDFLVNGDTPILSTFDGTSVGGSKQNAFVSINPAAPVPLPPAALLFGPALLGVFGLRKINSRKRED